MAHPLPYPPRTIKRTLVRASRAYRRAEFLRERARPGDAEEARRLELLGSAYYDHCEADHARRNPL